MKEKKVQAATSDAVNVIPIVAEKISDNDQALLDNAKLKSELAMEKVKTAIVHKENVELSYENLVLQIALKYNLKVEDIIEANGEIRRFNK